MALFLKQHLFPYFNVIYKYSNLPVKGVQRMTHERTRSYQKMKTN